MVDDDDGNDAEMANEYDKMKNYNGNEMIMMAYLFISYCVYMLVGCGTQIRYDDDHIIHMCLCEWTIFNIMLINVKFMRFFCVEQRTTTKKKKQNWMSGNLW